MNNCSTRKKNSSAGIVTFDKTSQLPADWDDDLPQQHFLTKQTLAAHEQTNLPDIKNVYAGIKNHGKWIMRVSFQVLSIKRKHLNGAALKPWQRQLWSLFTAAATPKLLIAGQLFRHDIAACYWQKTITPFDAFHCFDEIITTIVKEKCVQAVLVKETPPALVPYFLHHAPEYLMLRNDSSMKLKIAPEWQTITDYEKSLKHKYAQRFRKVRQSWGALQVKELDTAAVEQHAGRIYQLYAQVIANQPVQLGFLNQHFIPVLKAHYGDKLKIWGIFESGELIAFASAWVQTNSFDMFYIGFDYRRNTDLQLYFNILFFSIEQAILLRKPILILGRTALEAKARVGCRPEYLHTFLYIRNRFVRNMVAKLQEQFSEKGGEWENRHPFKNEPA